MRFSCATFALAGCIPLLAVEPANLRVIRFSEATPFHMGKVTSARIVSPATGAKELTLNLSTSQPGDEFSQHTHDGSTDTILVLEGAADLRQGPNRTNMKAGTLAFVPGRQIHGTITTAKDTVMISTQVPPDLVLYTGARDSSKPGAAPVQGDITPGAVKYLDFASKDGILVDSSTGPTLEVLARRVLKQGQSLEATGLPGGEQVFFVWKGAVRIRSGSRTVQLGERDTVLWQGGGTVQVTGDSLDPAIVIQIQAPASSK